MIKDDEIFRCDNCRIVTSPNEAVWDKDGERICLHCSPKEEIHTRSKWLTDYYEEHREIENRWDLLDFGKN